MHNQSPPSGPGSKHLSVVFFFSIKIEKTYPFPVLDFLPLFSEKPSMSGLDLYISSVKFVSFHEIEFFTYYVGVKIIL